MTSATDLIATELAEYVPVNTPRGGVFLGFTVVIAAWSMVGLGIAALVG